MHRIEAQRGAPPRVKTLAALRGLLVKAGVKSAMAPNRTQDFSLGAENVDAFLGGGLRRACLHEIHAPWGADGPAAAGFSLGLALRAAPGRPVFWVRQDVMEGEGGRLNGMGLAEFGVAPAALSLVRGKDAEAVLRAGVEAARCKSLGSALIEIFGAPRALDFTATLRLARAAEVSGVTVFLLRIRAGEGAKTGPPPSAAASRWRARAQNSRALLANAPGAPCFSVTLLRHSGGAADRSWRLEWQRDRGLFQEAIDGVSATLSGALAALPADGKAACRGSAAPDDEAPFALVEKQKNAQRLCALNTAALRQGLVPGLSLADARARLPQLGVAEIDRPADAQILARLAARCERYTPLTALDEPHGLVLDVTGCAHLFGGEQGLFACVLRDIDQQGFSARAAVAGTPDCARALARFSAGGVFSPEEAKAAAARLPLAALEMDEEHSQALRRAGLKTLGDVAARSSRLFAARFGDDFSRKIERLFGREDVRINPLRPPPDCMVERHFIEPLTHAESIETALRDLMLETANLLARRGQGGRVFEAGFFRADGFVRRLRIETLRPTRDPQTLFRLFREKLDALADPLDPGFGFDALRLSVPRAENFETAQADFSGAAAQELGTGIERIARPPDDAFRP